eukprot:2122805-Pleurochrysis_carterae.AAC.2
MLPPADMASAGRRTVAVVHEEHHRREALLDKGSKLADGADRDRTAPRVAARALHVQQSRLRSDPRGDRLKVKAARPRGVASIQATCRGTSAT